MTSDSSPSFTAKQADSFRAFEIGGILSREMFNVNSNVINIQYFSFLFYDFYIHVILKLSLMQPGNPAGLLIENLTYERG
jgi:hypothetical protein